MVTGSGHNDGPEDALGAVVGQLPPLDVIIVPYALHERPAGNVHRGAVDLRLLRQPLSGLTENQIIRRASRGCGLPQYSTEASL